jgi:hypothetical protein
MPRHKTHTVTRRSRTNETLSVDEITQTSGAWGALEIGRSWWSRLARVLYIYERAPDSC